MIDWSWRNTRNSPSILVRPNSRPRTQLAKGAQLFFFEANPRDCRDARLCKSQRGLFPSLHLWTFGRNRTDFRHGDLLEQRRGFFLCLERFFALDSLPSAQDRISPEELLPETHLSHFPRLLSEPNRNGSASHFLE